MHWHKTPFARPLVFFVLGLTVGYRCFINLQTEFFICSVFFLVLVILRLLNWRNLLSWAVWLFFFLFGFTYLHFHQDKFHDNFIGHQPDDWDALYGALIEVKDKGHYWSLVLATTYLEYDTQLQESRGKILLRFYDPCAIVRVGDFVRIKKRGSFKKVYPTLEANFDYGQYLLHKDICFQSNLGKQDLRVYKTERNPLTLCLLKAKVYMSERLARTMHSYEAYALMWGLLTGDKTLLPEEVKMNFRKAGAMHFLAVSGFHVGVVFQMVLLISTGISFRAKRFKVLMVVVSIVLVWGFTIFTGLGASAVRAALMLTIGQMAVLWRKEVSAIHIVLLTCFGLLLVNPFWLKDIGFQLSFVAVFFISAGMPLLADLKQRVNKWWFHLWSVIYVSLVAQVGVLGLLWYYFQEISTMSIFSSVLLGPLVWVLFMVAIFGLVNPFTALQALIGTVWETLLQVVLSIVEWFASFPSSILILPEISLSTVLLLYIGLMVAWNLCYYRKYQWLYLLVVVNSCFLIGVLVF